MFSHILVPLDGSKLSERAIPYAVQIARIFHARLTLLHVLDAQPGAERAGTVDPVSWQIRKAEADLNLGAQIKTLRDQGIEAEHHILEGRTPETIVQFAHDNRTDLLVLSSHGQGGLSRWNISSVIYKVLSKVYLPVLIVRAYRTPAEEAGQPAFFRKLLVPFDCSKRAECSLPVAFALAEASGGTVVLATVLRRPDVPVSSPFSADLNRLADEYLALSQKAYEAYLDDVRRRVPAENQVRVVVNDSVSRALHDLAEEEDADLVILCAHGRSAQPDWPYGSVTSNYIEHGSRPLLVMQDVPHHLARPSAAEIAAEKFGSR